MLQKNANFCFSTCLSFSFEIFLFSFCEDSGFVFLADTFIRVLADLEAFKTVVFVKADGIFFKRDGILLKADGVFVNLAVLVSCKVELNLVYQVLFLVFFDWRNFCLFFGLHY